MNNGQLKQKLSCVSLLFLLFASIGLKSHDSLCDNNIQISQVSQVSHDTPGTPCVAVSVPENRVVIVGAGIAGAFQAYTAYTEAIKKGIKPRIDMFEKNNVVGDTTASRIAPSRTFDEHMSVIPRGQELVNKMKIPFYEPGGIRVDDVPGVNTSPSAINFMEQADLYSRDEAGHQERNKVSLELGKMSMDLWQKIYDEADDQLRKIFIESNFNPCRETTKTKPTLHDGYRIDLIYSVPNAIHRALSMKADYESLGSKHCKILSPSEVMTIDPSLTNFCKAHSTLNNNNILEWNSDTVALWRPGGCIDVQVFLPKFYEYLRKKMGTCADESHNTVDCFRVHFGKKVQEVIFDKSRVAGLRFEDGTHIKEHALYVFCPGEAVGTLKQLGFKEPAYARFAGASLKLDFPVSDDVLKRYATFNHCMEVHQEGVVLAWQARVRDGKIFIAVAGTKAFYGDREPHKDEAFCKNRNLLQLNIINDVVPELVSQAIGRDTKGLRLTEADMKYLEDKGIAQRWVGSRSVVYDGFSTFGKVYTVDGLEITNAITATHLGSGGVSLAPAAAVVARASLNKDEVEKNPLVHSVLKFAKSNRVAV